MPESSRTRKVLIVTLHFPPSAASGAFRMLGFARHLPTFGWAPSVVASSENRWEPVDPGMARDIPDSAKVTYVPYPTGRAVRLWQRVLARLRIVDTDAVWVVAALTACRSVIREQQPDAILTSGPPHSVHLLGTYLKRHFRIPHVADFRDPWVVNEKTPAPQACLRTRLERFVMRNADAIIMNAPRAAELIRNAYPEMERKLAVVTNGFDPEPETAFEASECHARVRIMHAGELYAGRDPRPLLQAIRGLEPNLNGRGMELAFLGRTSESGIDIPAEARSMGCTTPVTIEGQVPYADAKRKMRDADILLLMDSAGRRAGIPAKLFEYMGAGRPILALAEPDGDTAWALVKSGIPHVIARPNDAGAIQEGLSNLIVRCGVGRKYIAASESAFTRKALAGQLADVLNGIRLQKHLWQSEGD